MFVCCFDIIDIDFDNIINLIIIDYRSYFDFFD